MVVRIRGGYNTATGWPPDESTGVEFQNDVEIPGQFKGGGAGFGWGDTELPGEYGPGGFYKPGGVPSIVGPATGQQGTSLSSVPRGGAATTPGDIFPPQHRPLRPGMSPSRFTGGTSTEGTFAPGEPMPGFNGLGGAIRAGTRRIPGIGQIIDAITPTEELAPRSMDEAPPWSWPGAGNPGMPGATVRGPIPMNPDAMPDAAGAAPTPNFVRPEGEVPRTYPMWPTPPAPVTAGPASYPHMPWPDTGVAPGIGSRAPATPPPRPGRRAAPAGPAAQRQKPNLGHYGPFVQVARPNADVAGGARGRQSVPYTTALDLSHLFGGGR